jgi:hypothetical protein
MSPAQTRFVGLRTGLAWTSLALALCLAAPAPRAQTAACPGALTDAEALYRAGRFGDVERRLDACLNGPEAGPVAAYRLRALALLRQQRLADAQETVLALLAAYPDYEPDRVQDPPAYVSLVTLVSRQLAVGPAAGDPRPRRIVVDPIAAMPVGPVPPAPDVALIATRPPPLWTTAVRPAPAGFRRRGAVSVEGSVGAESYDGERRRVGDGLVGGFVTNGGLSGGAAVAVQIGRRLSVEVRAASLTLPKLIRDGAPDSDSGYLTEPTDTLGFPVSEYVPIDPATSSRRVWSAALALRADGRPGRRVSPYVRAGGRAVVRRVNGETRVGFGPEGALGVEVAAGPRVAVFGEATGTLVVPDHALDGATFRTNGDLLLGARGGLRLRLGPEL